MAFIEVTAIGNLTRDPELRVTPKGTSICQFGLAVNKKWKDEAGQEREDVCFVDIEAWGKQGEAIAKFFKKGHPIYLRGVLKQDTWEDKTSGQKKSKHKVLLERFEFIRGKGEDSPPPPAPPPRPAAQGTLPGAAPDLEEDVPF